MLQLETLGSSDISYSNYSKLICDIHATIKKENEKWVIQNNDIRFGTFVNDEYIQLNSKRVLENGDIVFIMGLKIIIIEDCLFINSPINGIQYNDKKLRLLDNQVVEYESVTSDLPNNDEEEIYSDNDYFSRAPRIRNIIENETIKIDSPTAKEKNDEFPIILTLGPSISTGIMMLVSTYASLNGMINNNASVGQVAPTIIIAIIMLISTMVLPIAMNKYQKRLKKQKEEKRQNKYRKYIESKILEIDKVMERQKEALLENFVSTNKCAEIIVDRDSRLWERKIEDFDFLNIRLGIGEVPLNAEIIYPEERFSLDEDNLVEILNQVVNKSKMIQDAPISLSLTECNNSALIVKSYDIMQEYLKSIIIQLIAFQSYEDLKLVFLLKDKQDPNWEYVKKLPHVWDDSKQIRFFANDYSEMIEISKYLEEEYQRRASVQSEVDFKSFQPYYLIISDDPDRVKNLIGIAEISKSKVNLGFSVLYITDNISQLPNECKTFINIINDRRGELFESEMSSKSLKRFELNLYDGYYFENICQTIGNIPIKTNSSNSNMLLPNSYSFLEMYNVGKIEQLNILERWKKNDSTISLKAPIGIDGMGMPIMLDIHEKYHGPHGLIAGSTGSGKSEFIITYILSLSINYHPDDVAFLLIDYKGGGLAGAFKKNNVVLPHLVGTITNIDKVGLQRSLDSIQSELRRRQVMFNEARNMTEESTIDIYKYQRLYHQGAVKTPIPHLLIICDEFAELKQQQEDFMDELISVARIGRSLGVHLILATQKPAGIVNDQIRSNSKFGVCLKVQDREDSMDIIRRPDAINIKRAGEFYLAVGNNEYFVLGQSGWSGALYFPSDVVRKETDNSMEFINNTGNVVKKVDNIMQKKVSSNGDQVTNLVKYISKLASSENIKLKQLWLDNVPEVIYSGDIKKKYNIKAEKNIIAPVVGEYDDPYNQKQGPVLIDFNKDGNIVIFGNAESGKETLLSTIMYEIMSEHNQSEALIYIFDFGSEALRIFKDSPVVGDIVFIDENEKISRFFNMIRKEIKDRKEILYNYNGSYDLYLKSNNAPMPRIIIIINNYEALTETYEYEYDDIIQSLTREGSKFGIMFVVTANSQSSIRYRLMQNFKKRIALQLNNDDDYLNVFDKLGKKRPSRVFGRGLIEIDEAVHEFQTARICKNEEYSEFIASKIEQLRMKTNTTAKAIPTLPNEVKIDDIIGYLGSDLSAVPIGIEKKDLEVCVYNFSKEFINVISSQNIDNITDFIFNVLSEIDQKFLYLSIGFFDAEGIIQDKRDVLKQEYKQFISNVKSNKEQNYLGVIIGIDKFLNSIGEDDVNFAKDLEEISLNKNCNFIVVDSATKIKNHAFEPWYQNNVHNDVGIWIGNGISDQYTINVSVYGRNLVNNCGNSYGYVISAGEPTMIKLLGVADKEENDD